MDTTEDQLSGNQRGTKRVHDLISSSQSTTLNAPASIAQPILNIDPLLYGNSYSGPIATDKSSFPAASPLQTTSTPHLVTSSAAAPFASQPPPAALPAKTATSKAGTKASRTQSSSAFRNVSACNRCRIRKNRCDQQLPACKPCEKAGVKCTSFDPLLNRETPRSYVYYLESRSSYLEDLLEKNGIDFMSAESYALDKGLENEGPVKKESTSPLLSHASRLESNKQSKANKGSDAEEDRVDKLVSEVAMVNVQGASNPHYLGSGSGISFARVVFQAIKSSVAHTSSERDGRSSKLDAAAAGTSSSTIRDSVFGLQTKPTIKPAVFPDRELALRLITLYFQHTHPQMPILHRGQFMSIFERVYDLAGHSRTPREFYFLNIVFAIGAGVIVDNPVKGVNEMTDGSTSKTARVSGEQGQPEEYHAAAIVHLEGLLASCSSNDSHDGVSGALEELQAVLLLANFALLRPVPPGLWYIIGTAVRLAVDLGLHHEEDEISTPDTTPATSAGQRPNDIAGRRHWTREIRRRLWWCVYSFDRHVSMCVGRPFGINDQVITTEFPSLLDDKYISPSGLKPPPDTTLVPSSKLVTHHYLRLRLLQSEIMQVLQHTNAQSIFTKKESPNEYMYTGLPSQFLQPFQSFRHWRIDVDRRLWEWKESAPQQQQTGVEFSPLFYDLNYWQAVIMLYRPSLTAPTELSKELDSFEDYRPESPGATSHLDEQGDEEFVCLKIAEAGQKVLKLYRQLHRVRLVNQTYLSTHSLFMAGISFLYAIWHSPVVRSHLSLDDVDFTVLAATSVLSDMIENCPPAESCKEAFDRMSKATIKMAMSTTGFGPSAVATNQRKQPAVPLQRGASSTSNIARTMGYQDQSQMPTFDMNLSELFSVDEANSQALNRPSYRLQMTKKQRAAPKIKQQKQPRQQPAQLSALAPQTSYRPQSSYSTGMYDNIPIDPMLQQQQQNQQQQYPQHLSPQSTRSSAPLYDQNYALPQANFSTPTIATNTTTPNQFDPNNPPDLPMQIDIDIDTSLPDYSAYDDYNNDAGVDFNILNSMLGGHMSGANLFDGGAWEDQGAWGGDGTLGDGTGANVEGGRDGGAAGGNGSGSGADMFGGLFFG